MFTACHCYNYTGSESETTSVILVVVGVVVILLLLIVVGVMAVCLYQMRHKTSTLTATHVMQIDKNVLLLCSEQKNLYHGHNQSTTTSNGH